MFGTFGDLFYIVNCYLVLFKVPLFFLFLFIYLLSVGACHIPVLISAQMNKLKEEKRSIEMKKMLKNRCKTLPRNVD